MLTCLQTHHNTSGAAQDSAAEHGRDESGLSGAHGTRSSLSHLPSTWRSGSLPRHFFHYLARWTRFWSLFLGRKSAFHDRTPKTTTELRHLQYEATSRYFARTPAKSYHSTLPEVGEHAPVTPWPALLFAGGVAGVVGWLVTFPFDVVKTRVQSTLSTSPDNPFRNMWSTIIYSYRTEGMRVFFHGIRPTLIR